MRCGAGSSCFPQLLFKKRLDVLVERARLCMAKLQLLRLASKTMNAVVGNYNYN